MIFCKWHSLLEGCQSRERERREKDQKKWRDIPRCEIVQHREQGDVNSPPILPQSQNQSLQWRERERMRMRTLSFICGCSGTEGGGDVHLRVL